MIGTPTDEMGEPVVPFCSVVVPIVSCGIVGEEGMIERMSVSYDEHEEVLLNVYSAGSGEERALESHENCILDVRPDLNMLDSVLMLENPRVRCVSERSECLDVQDIRRSQGDSGCDSDGPTMRGKQK